MPSRPQFLVGTASWTDPTLVKSDTFYPPALKTAEERLRFTVRPGITGLAQVSGRNILSWDGRIACDVRYVREWSLALDLKILALTVWHTITRHGLQADPVAAASMLNFDDERRQRRQMLEGEQG